MRKSLQYLWLASIALMLHACVTTVNRGHLKEDEELASVKPGITTADDTRKLLGSPSSESSFGPKTWYYMSSVRKSRTLLAPRVVDQHVTEIGFNSAGIVTGIREYNLADGKDVQTASRYTPTEGQQLGFFEQIMANLGRFNNSNANSASNSHTHGGSGAPGDPTSSTGVYR